MLKKLKRVLFKTPLQKAGLVVGTFFRLKGTATTAWQIESITDDLVFARMVVPKRHPANLGSILWESQSYVRAFGFKTLLDLAVMIHPTSAFTLEEELAIKIETIILPREPEVKASTGVHRTWHKSRIEPCVPLTCAEAQCDELEKRMMSSGAFTRRTVLLGLDTIVFLPRVGFFFFNAFDGTFHRLKIDSNGIPRGYYSVCDDMPADTPSVMWACKHRHFREQLGALERILGRTMAKGRDSKVSAMPNTGVVNELQRTYYYEDHAVTITQPDVVFIRESKAHCIQDSAGDVHYVPPGWTHFKWTPKDKTNPIDF